MNEFRPRVDWRAGGSIAAVALALATFGGPARAQTLSTSAPFYMPGDTAQVTGSGFHPNEPVTLQVTHATAFPPCTMGGVGHEPWSVIANGSGGFDATWYLDPLEALGSSLVVAADCAHGNHEEAGFDDGGPLGVACISNVVSLSGHCVASTTAGGGNQFWDLEPGGTYRVTLSGVAECSGSTIQGIVMGGTFGQPCLAATEVGPGTYQFDFTVPATGCETSPIKYCTTGCSSSTGFFARQADCTGLGHLRAAAFGAGCANPTTILCGPPSIPPQFTTACPMFKITVGSPLSFAVSVVDLDPGQTVVLTSTPLPAGASMSPPLPTSGNPVSSTFSWTPSAGQQGVHVVTFTACDDGSPPRCTECTVTIVVDAFNLLAENRGTVAGGAFGAALAHLGDLDGDGRPDFLVGAPGANEVRILSGAGGVLLALSGAPAEQFGCAVANVGDLNGDGVPDFFVGAREGVVAGVGAAGRALVHSGASGALLHSFEGTNAGEQFGCSIASAGDVDGDGVGDLIVGVPGANVGGLANAGEARVYSGVTGALLRTLAGTTAGAEFGFAVAGAGDLDGDGRSDLFVGGPGANRATAFSGATGAALFSVAGYTPGDRLGASVAVVGDVNYDGVPDLVVGAPSSNAYGLVDSGEARLVSGANGSLLHRYSGMTVGEGLGAAVSAAGDIDNDGTPDVAVSVAAGLHTGGGEVRVFSGWNGFILSFFKGTPYGEGFGSAVAFAGDLDGNGLPDLLVGAPQADPCGSTDAGLALVFSHDPVPPGAVTSFGTGSAGSGGFVPMAAATGGAPAPGNAAFRVTVSQALGGTSSILILGLSSVSWQGVPLPLNLGILGIPGSTLYVAADFRFLATTCGSGAGMGQASVGIPLPSNPTLSGSEAFFQWYVVDPGPLPIPGVVSDALRVVFQ